MRKNNHHFVIIPQFIDGDTGSEKILYLSEATQPASRDKDVKPRLSVNPEVTTTHTHAHSLPPPEKQKATSSTSRRKGA